jgi:uncharacterized protein
MNIPSPFKDALEKFVSEAVQTYPNELVRIILFGSLARGEEREDSDMDIMVIVNEESIELRRNLIGIGFDIQLETGINLSIKVVSEDQFKAHENFSFYKTISSEGVPIGP